MLAKNERMRERNSFIINAHLKLMRSLLWIAFLEGNTHWREGRNPRVCDIPYV